MSCKGSLSDICVVAYESGHLCLFDSSTHSIIEEYSLFYRKIEGIILTFKKDQELEKMKRNHLQNLEKIKKRQEEIKRILG